MMRNVLIAGDSNEGAKARSPSTGILPLWRCLCRGALGALSSERLRPAKLNAEGRANVDARTSFLRCACLRRPSVLN